MIRCAFVTMAALAGTLAFGVSAGVAAPASPSPLAKVAAHDGVSLPPALTHAIKQKLGTAPRAEAAAPAAPSTQQQELQAGDGMPLDLFGWTVSLTADGHTALVGAPGRIVGAAYVFTEHAGKWSEQQELQSPAGSAEDSYGWSVALAGDGQTALVGAYSGNGLSGIVYSYSRQGGATCSTDRSPHPTGPPGTSSARRSHCRDSATSR